MLEFHLTLIMFVICLEIYNFHLMLILELIDLEFNFW